jgi:hypothetical protein
MTTGPAVGILTQTAGNDDANHAARDRSALT